MANPAKRSKGSEAVAPKKLSGAKQRKASKESAPVTSKKALKRKAVAAEMESLLPEIKLGKKKLTKGEQLLKKKKKALKEKKLLEQHMEAVDSKKKKTAAVKSTKNKKVSAPSASRGKKTSGKSTKLKSAKRAPAASPLKKKEKEKKKATAVVAAAAQPVLKKKKKATRAPRELSPEELAQLEERERQRINEELKQQAIKGDVSVYGRTSLGETPETLVPDPILYPQLPFFEDYTENRKGQLANEEELLRNAHQYFSALNKKERLRNQVASKRIQELKRLNRAGGDKDGFRYVIPKDVRAVAQQMMLAEGIEGADVEKDKLSSVFGGDGVQETASKPMRSMKKKQRAFKDFYQFQVSKRWTRNAENFLARSRSTRAMFAAKKQQRSIKKL